MASRMNKSLSDDALLKKPNSPVGKRWSLLDRGQKTTTQVRKRGFNLLAAFDVGVTGTSTFIEELKPEAPWMLYLGAGWVDLQAPAQPTAPEYLWQGANTN